MNYRDVPDDTTDPMFPSVVPGTNDAGANKMVKVSKLTESANKIKSAESYKTRSFIHNDLEEQRESWVIIEKRFLKRSVKFSRQKFSIIQYILEQIYF